MIITLKKYGKDSRALVIPKPILKLLDIDDKTEFNLETNGKRLNIQSKVDQDNLVDEAIKKTDKKYGNVFQSLAEK